MLSFISFGSGSSGNCYYLRTATDGILIDAGISFRTLKKHLRERGLSLATAKAIIVTHDHADHVKAVGVMSSECNLPVYATASVHHGIERNYCVQKKVSGANMKYVEKGVPFSIGSFVITPFDVPHDSTDNVGYRIEVEGKVFCIITDAGSITDEIRGRIAEADYLVMEANYDETMLANGPYPLRLKQRIASSHGHMSNSDCAHAIADNMGERLKRVWLCHLSEENNHPELARKTVEAAVEARCCGTGRDIDIEVLKRKTPSDLYVLSGKAAEQLSLFADMQSAQ